MKLWDSIKSLPIWITIGAVATAALMAFSGARATQLERRAKNAEKNAENLAHDRTRKSIDKAKKLNEAAAADKARAAKAREAAEKRLEEIGNKDETLDAIADRFNSRRLRKPTD